MKEIMGSDMRAYLGYVWKSHRGVILFGFLFIATIQFLLIYFNSTLDIAPMVELMLEQFPSQIKEMYGEEILSQISTEGSVAFGLEHPLVMIFFIFISFSMVTRNITTSSGNQLMEIILAHPFERKRLISGLYILMLIIIAFLTLGAFTGAILAIKFFHEMERELIINMMLADINAFLLHSFIMSYALFFSVKFKDVSKAIRISAIITLVFYFMDIISDIFDSLRFTRPYNFFTYFHPPKVMEGDPIVFTHMIVLTTLSTILFVTSYYLFNRKDIA